MSKRRPNLAPPLIRTRNAIWRFLKRRLGVFSPTARSIAIFALLVLATTMLVVNPYTRIAGENYKEGDVLKETIVSPADIIETDERETARWREAAAETVNPIFRFDSNRAAQAVRSLRAAWEDLERQQRAASSNANLGNSNAPKADLNWTGQGGADVGRTIAARGFRQADLELLTEILRDGADGYIYADTDAKRIDSAEITLVDRSNPMQQSSLQMPESKMTSLSAARARLRERIFEADSFTTSEKQVFFQALAPLVQPSVTFDEAVTTQAKTAAANQVPIEQIALKRGQTIAREGDTVTPQILKNLAAIRAYQSSTRQWNRFFGLLLIIGAMYWVVRQFVIYRAHQTKLILSPERTFAFIGLVLLLQTVLLAVGFRLAEFTAAQNLRAPFSDPNNWALIVPFASAALLVTLLIDGQIAVIVGGFTALAAGLLAPTGIEFAVYAAISSSVAVYGFERYRTRQAVTIAGLLIGGTNALIGLALLLYSQQPLILNTFLLVVSCGVLGGIVAAAVVSVLLPVFESTFGILTDVKLLELSNADLPVLGELALRAPGTNQHSHAVGQLAENAARAIGANPLLTRIGALYHDIGKLAAPQYFVENQVGANPHDGLKPKHSARIIVSHVSYGEKLAKEIGLPQRIIDFIVQHHGTRTLHYFLKKAQDAAKEGETVDEKDFRYAGPKPQTKEAAVLMIADSCEAAARSLSQPTEENIHYIVNKIVDAIVADDQLAECDLTLSELTIIRESMLKSLVAIYHSRVSYPGFTPPAEQNSNGAATNGTYQSPKEIPISKGGEVEGEIVSKAVSK
ncbi:MAG: HDIG domain-containing protein [Acidobacteriota bacterium]|nr:HDIG domain-containing protein [Acidobacteriota bacterium]